MKFAWQNNISDYIAWNDPNVKDLINLGGYYDLVELELVNELRKLMTEDYNSDNNDDYVQ